MQGAMPTRVVQSKKRFSEPSSSSRIFRANASARIDANRNGETKTFGRGYWYLLLWITFFGVSGYVLLFSPFLRIANVNISGLESIEESTVREVFDRAFLEKKYRFFPPDNYLLFDSPEMENRVLLQLEKIQSAHIEKRFPDTVAVAILERKTVVIWCAANSACRYVDENGIAYAPVDERFDMQNSIKIVDRSDAPESFVDPIIDSELVSFVTSFRDVLREEVDIDISYECETPSRFANEVSFVTNEGWRIIANPRIDAHKVAVSLKTFLHKEVDKDKRTQLRYVDLRVENRAYYALTEEEQKDSEASSEDTLEKVDEKQAEKKTTKKK